MTGFLLLRHGFCVTLVTLQENPHCSGLQRGKWQYQSSYIGCSPHDDRRALWYRAELWVGLKTWDLMLLNAKGIRFLFVFTFSWVCISNLNILIRLGLSLLWCVIQPLSLFVILNHSECKLYLCLLSTCLPGGRLVVSKPGLNLSTFKHRHPGCRPSDCRRCDEW